MKLTFCAACGSRDNLRGRHLINRDETSSGDEAEKELAR